MTPAIIAVLILLTIGSLLFLRALGRLFIFLVLTFWSLLLPILGAYFMGPAGFLLGLGASGILLIIFAIIKFVFSPNTKKNSEKPK